MEFVTVRNGEVALNVAVAGEGPLILCVHGWPELWYSWRHQLAHFAPLGYKVAAMDVRGYGGSSRPHAIEAYTLRNLASDVAAVIDALGDGKAILLGHDWGAPIVWTTSLIYPEKIVGVAGLSVPYMPPASASLLTLARQLYAGRFFYQLYFLQEGIAEAELEADVRATLRKTYYMASGDERPDNVGAFDKPADAKFLDGLIDPQPFPPWLSERDLEVFAAAFETSGFRGPLNRYRAQDLDVEELAEFRGKPVTRPACFIAGGRDPVRRFVPGVDPYAQAGANCTDFRGSTIIEHAGHWVQQEAPAETNAALEAFVRGL